MMAETYGTCDPTFNAVRELLAQQVANGSEVGVSICVNINRKDVLDIWSGHADLERTKPWDKDTLTPAWSCSKVVTNLAALMLIDRGLIDLHGLVRVRGKRQRERQGIPHLEPFVWCRWLGTGNHLGRSLRYEEINRLACEGSLCGGLLVNTAGIT